MKKQIKAIILSEWSACSENVNTVRDRNSGGESEREMEMSVKIYPRCYKREGKKQE